MISIFIVRKMQPKKTCCVCTHYINTCDETSENSIVYSDGPKKAHVQVLMRIGLTAGTNERARERESTTRRHATNIRVFVDFYKFHCFCSLFVEKKPMCALKTHNSNTHTTLHYVADRVSGFNESKSVEALCVVIACVAQPGFCFHVATSRTRLMSTALLLSLSCKRKQPLLDRRGVLNNKYTRLRLQQSVRHNRSTFSQRLCRKRSQDGQPQQRQ